MKTDKQNNLGIDSATNGILLLKFSPIINSHFNLPEDIYITGKTKNEPDISGFFTPANSIAFIHNEYINSGDKENNEQKIEFKTKTTPVNVNTESELGMVLARKSIPTNITLDFFIEGGENIFGSEETSACVSEIMFQTKKGGDINPLNYEIYYDICRELYNNSSFMDKLRNINNSSPDPKIATEFFTSQLLTRFYRHSEIRNLFQNYKNKIFFTIAKSNTDRLGRYCLYRQQNHGWMIKLDRLNPFENETLTLGGGFAWLNNKIKNEAALTIILTSHVKSVCQGYLYDIFSREVKTSDFKESVRIKNHHFLQGRGFRCYTEGYLQNNKVLAELNNVTRHFNPLKLANTNEYHLALLSKNYGFEKTWPSMNGIRLGVDENLNPRNFPDLFASSE